MYAQVLWEGETVGTGAGVWLLRWREPYPISGTEICPDH
jgi:hypothetical protein